jgi:hypothetical protein
MPAALRHIPIRGSEAAMTSTTNEKSRTAHPEAGGETDALAALLRMHQTFDKHERNRERIELLAFELQSS